MKVKFKILILFSFLVIAICYFYLTANFGIRFHQSDYESIAKLMTKRDKEEISPAEVAELNKLSIKYNNLLIYTNLSNDDKVQYVDFEKGADGIRYYINSNIEMHTDHEYLNVYKIDSHWYSYARDWN